MDRDLHQFSGGQRQCFWIMQALAMQPHFIVADEPDSSLYVFIQVQVINLLQGLRQQFHLNYSFISHDLSTVNYISNREAVMYLGQIIEECSTCGYRINASHRDEA